MSEITPTYTDRPYQASAIPAIKDALIAKQYVLVVAPCAAGKTYIAARVAQWMLEHDRTTLMLLDREVLAAQNAIRFEQYLGVRPGVACSSLGRKDMGRAITIGSRQTVAPMLRNGAATYKCSLVIPDEAHLIGRRGQFPEIFKTLLANYNKTRFLGFTATPFRLKSGPIYGPGKMFDAIDYKITAKELLEPDINGDVWLTPLRWKIRESDFLRQLDQVSITSTGELDEKQQAEVLEQPTFVAGVYDIWAEYFRDLKTCIYGLNIKHAEAINAVFNARGVRTWIIHSKLKDVRKPIAEFTACAPNEGVMINVGMLTIGSDIPSMQGIIMARRTESTSLHYQIVGRLQRLFPGKLFGLVADLCGNRNIHGDDVDNPISITMGDSEPVEQARKVCPLCETLVGLQTKTCPDCGFKFPIESEQPPEQKKIRDHGPVGKLVDAVPFKIDYATEAHYHFNQVDPARKPRVECVYLCQGRWVRQYLYPEAQKDSFPWKWAGWYWTGLGGKWPRPGNAAEWVKRAGELATKLKIIIDDAGKVPVVKRVEKI